MVYQGLNLNLYKYFENLPTSGTIIFSLAIILMAGFGISRITKLFKMPNVTGYILAGLLIGPYVLGLIPPTIIEGMSFLSDIALAFIAFGVGRFFKKEILKKTGGKVIVITIFEALLAGFLVTLVMGFAFPKEGWDFALLLGAIATATAPASTVMTINQFKAKGDFVDTLLQVVALDDVVCLLIYSLATAIVGVIRSGGTIEWTDIVLPLVYNLLFILGGFLCGFLLKFLLKKRGQNNRLIIVCMMLCTITGIASFVNISPLLSCMVLGATYINLTDDEIIYQKVSNFTPPIMLTFFVLSGMKMDLSSFATIGIMGIVYFLVRIVGKYSGAYLGCLTVKKEKKTRDFLGLGLIPQAGVAIGLAFMGERMLPPEIGSRFLSIILCSSVLYEMTGPLLAKFALIKSGAIAPEMLHNKKVIHENLVDDINQNSQIIDDKNNVCYPEEAALPMVIEDQSLDNKSPRDNT